jgi:N6-adenosine-specific RNA methylase IME4
MDNKVENYYNKISKKCKVSNKKKFDILVVDPPWNQGKTGFRDVRPNQTKILDYPTLSKEDIKKLPIQEWSKDSSLIWLWVTNSKDKKTKEPIIKIGFELLEHWGFNYYTTITWDKKTGPCPFGPYQITTEHILFGYKGKTKFARESLGKMKTCFTESSSAHSVKPDSFYQLLHKYFKGDKLDVFARQKRIGFTGWGNQYGKLSLSVKKTRIVVSNKKQLSLAI